MKDIKLEDVLPITAMQYFTTFIESPDVKYQYLLGKGHADVDVGPWVPCSADGKYERVSHFSTNLSNNAIVKKLTGSVSLKIQETQVYYFSKQGDLHVVSTMIFSGSSLAENFSSRVEWAVSTLPNDHSEVRCNVKTEYKGYMFKGLIEKYVHQAACDSFHHWLKVVREKISLLQVMQEDNMDTKYSDQSVPSFVSYTPSTPSTTTDDSDDDDEFYDSFETAPSTTLLHLRKSTTPPIPPETASARSFSRISPPLTATLPAPPTNPNHVIFSTYNAGRPPTLFSQPSKTFSPLLPPTTSTLPTTYPPLLTPTPAPLTERRGWESAGEGERRQEGEREEYKQRFAAFAAQVRERERDYDERLLRMTQRVDAQVRRTRWLAAVLAAFVVVWPALARRLLPFFRWLYPLLRRRLGK